MAFLHAGDSDGRTTLTVIWRRFHAGLPETHDVTHVPRVSMDEQRDQNDDGDGYAEHQK
jgi:hypothetical protein